MVGHIRHHRQDQAFHPVRDALAIDQGHQRVGILGLDGRLQPV